MRSSSLTRCWTQAPCIGSTVLATGPPGKSLDIPFFNSRSICSTKWKGPPAPTKHPFTGCPQSLYKSSQARIGGWGRGVLCSLFGVPHPCSYNSTLQEASWFFLSGHLPSSLTSPPRFQARWWAFWSHYSTVPSLSCFAAHFIADPYHHPNQQVVWSLSQSLLLQKESIFSCLALEKWLLGLWSWCSRDRIWSFSSSFSSLFLRASDSHRFFLSQFPFYFIAKWLAFFMSVNPRALIGSWAMPQIEELLSHLCYLATWMFYIVVHMCVSM